MKVVLQRVERAKVTIAEKCVGAIGQGLLALIGIGPNDTEQTLSWMSDKITNLRIFSDDQGRMNRSVREVGGSILAVSQFTLYGDCAKGRRPNFTASAPPEMARILYEQFILELKRTGITVETGIFGAMMQVQLTNDGPVTLILEK